ncbi:flagellar hook-basal body protein [Paenibacillus sp. y28]|uniref:flagellar hook-basal body protein n=1 Tax=Paenibacillus sp. y28 TaxID=3129110 RepID=UPI00301B0F6B
MNDSLINASVSLNGLQNKLDVLAHNIANSNTIGFKRKNATFHDIFTSTLNQPQGFQQQGRMTPLGLTYGWGAKLSQIQVDMSQGTLKNTDNPMDFAIEGEALFEVQRTGADGNVQRTWTKDGAFSFSVNPANPEMVFLTTKEGNFVIDAASNQPIQIPRNNRIQVDADGNVMAYNEINRDEPPTAAGSLKLMHIIRPQLLDQVGEKLFALQNGVNEADALTQVAGQVDLPQISVRQGFLEQSNAILANEMTDLITTQRAYQMNARAITSADMMMGIANNLRA